MDPQRTYNKPRTKSRPAIVHNLQQALNAFRGFRHVTKLSVLNLEGRRVGELFEDRYGKYIVLYKREFYYHFSKHFPLAQPKGFGVMCNKKLVVLAAENGYDIVSVFPDGRGYKIPGMTFWDFYDKYDTDVSFVEGEIASSLQLWTRIF